ncbi:hypothetical protein B0J13DRAFT_534793 [Dactylonectria estremocensis]|uniref:Uncharacterized protein n=1 Tax=Dactylonectria estremocensis TaxID=1079267 RepID=A0A9P9CXC0_9HYPO|nr:hypothetical protein B0J13DRAFT_534793 [Dactylonectria estremocensis]
MLQSTLCCCLGSLSSQAKVMLGQAVSLSTRLEAVSTRSGWIRDSRLTWDSRQTRAKASRDVEATPTPTYLDSLILLLPPGHSWHVAVCVVTRMEERETEATRIAGSGRGNQPLQRGGSSV